MLKKPGNFLSFLMKSSIAASPPASLPYRKHSCGSAATAAVTKHHGRKKRKIRKIQLTAP